MTPTTNEHRADTGRDTESRAAKQTDDREHYDVVYAAWTRVQRLRMSSAAERLRALRRKDGVRP